MRAGGLGLVLLTAACAVARAVEAEPEWSTALGAGVCGVGTNDGSWESTRFCGALGADVVSAGPRRAASLGGGARLDATGFRDLGLSGGPTMILPVHRGWVTQVLVGPALLARERTTEGGVAGSLFVGYRSSNPYGSYAMAWGLAGGVTQCFGSRGFNTLWLGVRLDGVVVGIPAVALASVVRGRP